MNLLRRSFLVSILSLSILYPTADEITVVIGPNNTLMFLIGEEHGAPNPHEGGNEAVIQKVLEILKRAERSPDGGYRLFIERADSGLFSDPKNLDKKDLLSGLLRRAGEFKNSTFCDIEIRKASSGAKYILSGEDPNELARHFRGESAQEPAAQEMRERCWRRFQCDLNELTFQDVLDEFNAHLEWIEATSPNWWRYKNNDARVVRNCMAQIEEFMVEHGITKERNILSMSLALWKKGRNAYHYIQESLFDKIKGTAKELFNLVLFDRLLQESSIPSQKPIIVIAGGNHTSIMEQRLKSMIGITRELLVIEFNETGSARIPLPTDWFEILEKPLGFFEPAKSWYPCLLL